MRSLVFVKFILVIFIFYTVIQVYLLYCREREDGKKKKKKMNCDIEQ